MKLIKDNKVNEVNRVNNGQAVGLIYFDFIYFVSPF